MQSFSRILGYAFFWAASATAPAAIAQTLTIGVRGGPDSMDPHGSSLGTHAEAMKHMYDPLVWAGDDLQLEPGLALSWKATDDTTWEFKLRPGVKFHDGSDFTAEDVKATIERIPGVGGSSPTLGMLRRIDKIEIPDPLTIVFRTKGPAPALPADLNRLFIIPKKFKDAKSEDFVAGKAAVGSGPFKLESWQPKSDLVMTRHDAYWRGAAHWRRVIRKELPSDASRVASLLSGQADVINYVPASDWKKLQADNRLKVTLGDSIYIFNLQLDQRDKPPRVFDLAGKPVEANPFRDARVREAMDLAIDRNAIADIVLEGTAKPARNIVSPGIFGNPPDLPEKQFDLARARQLMQEAGFGAGFKVDLHCTSDRFPGDGATCQAIGQMLTRLGVQTSVNALTRTVFFPAHARLEYSLSMNGWGTLTGEASFSLDGLIHSPQQATGLGSWNRNGYARADLDERIVAASRELDDAKRRAIFETVFRETVKDRAWLPIVQLKTVWAARADKAIVIPRVDEETLAYFIKPAR